MNIYFPIAEINSNIGIIILAGFIAGVLSTMFGIGGGFITTPFLISLGVPPHIATSCSTHQIVGSSFMGVLTKFKPLHIDIPLAALLSVFGILGSILGFKILDIAHQLGQTDFIISITYIIIMTTLGIKSMINNFFHHKNSKPSKILNMPYQIFFKKSEGKISLIFIMILGVFIGILTNIMGIGGGFIMVPIMTHTLKLNKNIIIGTSLMQIFIITTFSTSINILHNHSVDLILSTTLIFGGIIGSFLGSVISKRIKFHQMNFLLAILILSISCFFAYNITKTPTEDNLFTVELHQQ